MTPDREIDVRLAVLNYFLNTPFGTSWEDFDDSWNNLDITQEEYNLIAPIFEKADLSNTKMPDIVVKVLNLINTAHEMTNPTPEKTLDESPKTGEIDGFTISLEPVFNITPEYIKRRFIEFNKKYFGGKLKVGGINFTTFDNNLNAYGFTGISVIDENNPVVRVFAISDAAGKTERVYCSTILHEMIHVYQTQVLKKIYRNETSHGSDFLSKMNEINNISANPNFLNGWNIDTNVTQGEINREVFTPKSPICIKLANDYFLAYVTSDQIGGPLGAAVLIHKRLVVPSFPFSLYKIINAVDLCKEHISILESADSLADIVDGLKLVSEYKINNWATKGIIRRVDLMDESKYEVSDAELNKLIENKFKESSFNRMDFNEDDLIKTKDPYHYVYIDDNGEILDLIC